MANIISALLACCVLMSVSFAESRPVPSRLTLAKAVRPTGRPLGVSTTTSTTEVPFEEEERPGTLDDCSQFCSQSYPQHTYPIPSNHKACVTGCHSAQVDALIAWPFQSSSDSCASACSEAYPSSGEQQYACVTGCNATTIDSLFPDRELIYSSDKPSGNDSNSDAALFDQAADLMDYVFNTFFSSFSLTSDLDRLTEHAQQMSQLLPPVKSSMITYVIQDGDVMELREYDIQGGVLTQDSTDTLFDFVEIPIEDEDVLLMGSDSDSPSTSKNDNGRVSGGSLDSYHIYYRPSSPKTLCGWFRNRVVAKRLLMGIAVVLICLGVLMCFLGVVRKDTNRRKVQKKQQFAYIQSHTPSTFKVPLDNKSQYRPDNSHVMVPVHIKVGGEKTVEGVLSVVT